MPNCKKKTRLLATDEKLKKKESNSKTETMTGKQTIRMGTPILVARQPEL